jgi:hypothetical protein
LKWVVTDEISFSNGAPVSYSTLFMDKSAGGVVLMPRHRELSDMLEGNIWARKLPRSANEYVQSALQKCANDKYFITVVDADWFGYRQPGRYGLLKALYSEAKFKRTSLTELRTYIKRKEFVKAAEGAAETRPFDMKKRKPFLLWQNDNNPIQYTLWQLFNLASNEIKNAGSKGDPQYIRAREMFDSASAGVNWLMASANPYWNSAYAMQAADDLAIAVFVLLSSTLKSKEAAIAQRLKIYGDIEEFEKAGDVKKWQKNFLRVNNIPFERFFSKPQDEAKE